MGDITYEEALPLQDIVFKPEMVTFYNNIISSSYLTDDIEVSTYIANYIIRNFKEGPEPGTKIILEGLVKGMNHFNLQNTFRAKIKKLKKEREK